MNRACTGRLLVSAALLASASTTHASPPASLPDNAKVFGIGLPAEISDLPPGRAQSRLSTLPAAAQQKALKWLQRFSFPEADLEFLRFDDNGGVLYADTHEVELTGDAADAPSPGIGGILPEDTFKLHSRPGASKVAFLDFDGHTLSGTAWNSGMPDPLYAKPFDTDGSPSSFSDDELNRIQEIWHRVAEDYAPFDIDVTTEEPSAFGPSTGRILVTHNTDANNNPMPYSSAGGVAYVGVYGESYYQSYSPALVYYNNLGNGFPTYVAEAASHEFGHNLSLSHDGRSDPYNEGYYAGHGDGNVSWGPIMGVGYYTNVTQWSRGEYDYANNTEDDLALIELRLGLRPDDHADDLSAATSLAIQSDGTISATNPETENYLAPSTDNKGVIETAGDIDVFSLQAGAGPLELVVEPAWAAFYRDTLRGANLDISATLYDEAGQVIASNDPLDETDASISTTVDAGIYYLAVGGVGNALSPYSGYGSLGQYFISGFVTQGSSGGVPTAPSYLAATVLSHDQISLTWNDEAVDETGYRVERSQDQTNWIVSASLPADSNAYLDDGLTESTEYFYRVVVFNGNGEASSNTISATTSVQAPTAPTAPSNVVASDGADGTAIIDWTDNSDNESAFEVRYEKLHSKRNVWQGTSIIDTTAADVTRTIHASGTGYFRYGVRAINAQGASDWSPWSEVAVTDASSGGGGKGGKGGGSSKCNPKKGSC